MAGNLDFMNAALFVPLIAKLKQHGAPADRILEEAGLSISALASPHGMIPRYAGWRFSEMAARYAGDPQFSYTCVMEQNTAGEGSISGLALVRDPTAFESLKAFVKQADKATSTTAFWLEMGRRDIWILRRDLRPMSGDTWQIEQYAIATFELAISKILGRKWLPNKLRICAKPNNWELPEAWRQIQITTGSESTAIAVPISSLISGSETLRVSGDNRQRAGNFTKTLEQELASQLAHSILPYIQENRAGIEQIAKAFGMSTRTFQRRLSDLDLTYSELVDEARYQQAIKLVCDNDERITEIALGLGYTHPENFTRSFRRRTGLSPREYRKMISGGTINA